MLAVDQLIDVITELQALGDCLRLCIFVMVAALAEPSGMRGMVLRGVQQPTQTLQGFLFRMEINLLTIVQQMEYNEQSMLCSAMGSVSV